MMTLAMILALIKFEVILRGHCNIPFLSELTEESNLSFACQGSLSWLLLRSTQHTTYIQ